MNNKDNSLFIKIIVLTAGFMLSVLSGWFIYVVEEKAIISEFKKDVDERAASLHREVEINFETLRSLGILFNGDTVPEMKRFTREAKNILTRHSNIQALEWIPRIKHAEREEYESKQRLLFPSFEITERKKQGHMVTAKQRKEYFPVYYIEPLIGNEVAFGFDLSSSPTRLKTLEMSRNTAKPLATASITLVQAQENQKGFLAFLPVYDGIPSTVDKRRETLKGFVLAVYRIADIFTSSALSKKQLGIEMKLVDVTTPSHHDILHVHQSRSGFSPHKEIIYKKDLPEFWGRKWSLIASPTLSYMSIKRDILPQTIFISGIVFTLLIVIYIHIITRRAATIKKLVIEKTNELTEANKKLDFLSHTDDLTQVANRRYLDKFFDKEWLRASRHKIPITFILIDIDYFKLYNDNFGHPKGDSCLVKVAEKLKEQVKRSSDLIARYGGEEFAIVLTHTEDAMSVANDCQRSIEELSIPHEFSEVSDLVTISVGVCTVIPSRGMNQSLLIETADKALYKAKDAGRNRVEELTIDL